GYGPWDGLITFDDTSSGRERYKISGQASQGGALRWVDQDAGDLTIINFSSAGSTDRKEPIVRGRMVRDKNVIAATGQPTPQAAVTGTTGVLRLNPAAVERVKLIDAKW